jgi:hypothetical protein
MGCVWFLRHFPPTSDMIFTTNYRGGCAGVVEGVGRDF